MAAPPPPTSLDTLITLKVNHNGSAKRFKLPLRDLTMQSLEDKIRDFLQISSDTTAVIERYSDSAAAFVTVERDNVQIYKQLFRAAKAKHKLKLRVSTPEAIAAPVIPQPATVEDEVNAEAPAAAASSLISPSTSTLVPAEQVPPVTAPISELPSQITTTTQVSQESLQATPLPFLPAFDFSKHPFTVCCNKCDKAVPNAHFHCSKCDDGDFDLCQECVNSGVTCNDETHWLIKRTIKDGEITQSTTAILSPKKTPTTTPAPKPVVASSSLIDLPIRPVVTAACRAGPAPTWTTAYNARTCNSCVQEFPEQNFVHCNTCDDFDLCKVCFVSDQHGHHPSHTFSAAVKGTVFEHVVSNRLAAGRNVLHNAICDGCEQYVRGVRHKCLDCPDWDYCSECVQSAALIHPNHRFVPVYEALVHPARSNPSATHYGIRCDGPLCTSKGGITRYIVGDRYKCAVCHDTDFCANCEASPANEHNKTHPLIKFRTPVRHVSVTTLGEHEDGQRLPPMGDRRARRQAQAPAAAPTPSPRDTIAASPVQTVVDVKPTESAPVEQPKVEEPVAPVVKEEPQQAASLDATFQHDTVADGTIFLPNHTFEQTWTLRNEGPVAWPAGCAVKFVGGDYMGAIDPNHPAGLQELASASESNVVSTTVAPGAEVSFTVKLRTPDREGKVISYWRLTTNDGHKFGHKLWCDVVVKKPAAVEQSREVVRSQMIIPRLEHESPSSSIIQDTRAEVETQAETATETASLASMDRAEEDFEDCAEADNWANESDSGFMTDEEYDILDASDEEYVSEPHKSASSRK